MDETLNLYLLERTDYVVEEEDESAVICAPDADAARYIARWSLSSWSRWSGDQGCYEDTAERWLRSATSTVTLLASNVDRVERGVVLARRR